MDKAIISPQKSGFILLVISISTILAALASQYIGGLVPCDLCLKQRMPYYIAIPLLILYLILPLTPLQRIIMFFVAVVFASGAGLAFYHAGVEYKFWPGPASCSGVSFAMPETIDALAQQLKNPHIMSCDTPAWQLFGISMAGYNAMISSALSLFSFFTLWRFRT